MKEKFLQIQRRAGLKLSDEQKTAFHLCCMLLVEECAKTVDPVPTCGPGSKSCGAIVREHFDIKGS